MIRLKSPVILNGEFTLGELNAYSQRGYDFSFRTDSDLRDLFLKLIKVPEEISLESLRRDLHHLGLDEVSIFEDGQLVKLSTTD